MEQNFSYYYIFNAVARHGNISKASKELFISQPAISKAIKKLEENLETCLFIRNSRGVYLSEEGKKLYEHTKLAFLEIEEGEKDWTDSLWRKYHAMPFYSSSLSERVCKESSPY